MRLRKLHGIITRRIGSVLFMVLYPLNQALKKLSRYHWEMMTRDNAQNGSLGIGRNIPDVYKANKSIAQESRSQMVFSVDIKQQLNLPNWAKEIQPFIANQLSRHTRRAYENDLRQFFQFMEGRLKPEEIEKLRPDHVILFRKYLEEGRLTGQVMSQATINRKLASVKSFLNWLKLNQLIPDNPALLVKGYPQSQESSLKGLSDEEVCKILDLPKRNNRSGALHGAILHFLLYMGVRKSELLDLKMGDLQEERGTPVVRVRGKGHKVRILPLTTRVRAYLEHYFYVCGRNREDTESPLFVPTKNNRTFTLQKRMNPHAITYIVQHYAKKAGILKPISPHSCRATCISNALDKKATHRSVQHLAGWSTPLMIQRYDKRREDLQNSAAFIIDYGESPSEFKVNELSTVS